MLWLFLFFIGIYCFYFEIVVMALFRLFVVIFWFWLNLFFDKEVLIKLFVINGIFGWLELEIWNWFLNGWFFKVILWVFIELLKFILGDELYIFLGCLYVLFL